MTSDTTAKIEAFLAGAPFAVVGASKDRSKYGNKVLRVYQQRGLEVYPVHPSEAEIEGIPCSKSLAALPKTPHGISIVTPPLVTERIVEEAKKLGIEHLWLQPGAESQKAIARAEELGLFVIAGGPCVLVVLGFRDA